jgi:hypothetical protein
MNARVANLSSELVPVAGAGMLSGTSFTAAQLHERASHFFISAEAESKMTADGSDPAGAGAVHTLPQNSNMTLRRSALLVAKFSAAVTVSQWELG